MNHLDFVAYQQSPVYFSPKWWDVPRWWLVRLLGGTCPHDTVTVTRIPVNGKDFIERLFKQKRVLTDQFRREPMELWMGAEDYEKLMSSPAILQAFTMSSEFNWGKREVYGLTVHVIPWMRGTLVMPRTVRSST